jgi:3-oxoacyl-[acyl-carrier-protein] synthase II
MEEIVITGAGLITGRGIGVKQHHINVLQDLTGGFNPLHEVAEFVGMSLEGLPLIVGEATVCAVRHTNAELAALAGVEKAARYDRHQLFGMIAAKEAMEFNEGLDLVRTACVGASGGAGLLSLFEADRRLLSGKKLGPFANLSYLPNIGVGYLTQIYGLKGPSHVHGTACAAAMHAANDAIRMIRLREIDAALVVGAEAAISPFGIASFQGQGALGNGHAFDFGRTGFVMGEGAGAFLIESAESARRRGVTILAHIEGYGDTSDGQPGLITDPSPDGAMRSAAMALDLAGITISEIDLVKAHATATGKGDLSEIASLRLLGATENLPVVSLKSHVGHLLGAAGVAELVMTLSMMHAGMMLPTRFLSHIDPGCMGVQHILESRQATINRVLANGFGFGGTNASLVVAL